MSKPTIVLLHGVGLDHTMWEPTAELLADRFALVTPDLPGHGRKRPAPAGTTLEYLALGVAPEIPPGAHLVGFSLGALVAQYLALRRPDLVATLTLVSSVCRRTPAEREAVLERLHVARADFGTAVSASLHRWYADTDVDAEWVSRTGATLHANDMESFHNCYRVFATADAELDPELYRIVIPAVAVTGADDPGSTPEMTHRLAAALPNCRAVIVSEARHMLPVQRPEALVDCVTTLIGDNAHA
ncbi:pimeloyl-ACP methyl ester carboxylesterase [Lipingzhangella halophila]|uniref:Pimeloyl-ACP methyl ester carboxylesterase n=1 Tax=Lipingzhangella halophila TaxID=1783352 RepID=A0A7W7RK81_9ACTN|nr:alpha/beta hydrolase [Lipingzhangella halophila]MBB4933529.1 pimeloyl-ACP methyl ester carboxylesterase [Lipingzhangella halophila]